MSNTLAVMALAGLLTPALGQHKAQTEDGDMVPIEGGTFVMGDVLGEGKPLERPTHEVTISSFLLGKTEITVGEFRKFAIATGYVTSAENRGKREDQDRGRQKMSEMQARLSQLSGDSSSETAVERKQLGAQLTRLYGEVISLGGTWCFDGETWEMKFAADWQKPGFEQASDHPVTCVSWDDAIHYCNWRSKKAGLPPAYDPKTRRLLDADGKETRDVTKVAGYRLPTEAEWEYAARDRGRKVRFGNGRDVAKVSEINCSPVPSDAQHAKTGKSRGRTTVVASFPPSRLGLYDMAGNVWEWCSDFVGRYRAEKQRDPYQLEGVQSRRAARGGRWGGGALELRASYRFGCLANDRCNNIGFRLARSK